MTTPPRPAQPAPPDRARTGAIGEDLAAAYLRERGYVILARNWRVATGDLRGELDLVCRDGDALVVVEVKTRRSDRFGGALAAVTPGKQRQIRALATAFLVESRLRVPRVRFDVVGIRLWPRRPARITHVPAAF